MAENAQTLAAKVFATLRDKFELTSRHQQQEMSASIGVTFDAGGAVMVEAPTGVGKTIGYLVPGIAAAITMNRRLIVSTATVALQEQSLVKDIPVVAKAFAEHGIEVHIAVIKGRGRYVCPLRLDHLAAQGTLLDGPTAMARRLESDFYGGWNGERDTYPDSISKDDWEVVKNDRHACIGDRCKFISKCPYYLNTEAAKLATVVVANHDLVLNGVMRSTKSLFANFAGNHYVFDEAHHLPDKAASVFAATAPCDLDYMIPRVADIMRLSSATKPESSSAVTYVTMASERMKSIGHKLDQIKVFDSNVIRFEIGVVPEHIRQYAIEARSTIDGLIADSLKAAATRLSSAGRSASSAEMIQLSGLLGELDDIYESLTSFIEPDEGKPNARWAETTKDGSWVLKASPFDAGMALRSMFWEPASTGKAGIAITSATLLPMGNADMAMRAFGFAENTATVIKLPTPYAETYRNNVEFVIPEMRYSPVEYRGHTNEVAFNILKYHDEDGGMLCLFASSRQMNDVAAMMPERIRSCLLIQGQMGHKALLEKHAEQIREDGFSVIFGLATFAEGVDLPGDLCTKVVIAKIPFPSPDEPLVAAACEWVENNGSSAFSSVLLPKASTVLKQGVGRLVRRESDRGMVIILDNRIHTKTYGKRLLACLGFPVTMAA